MAPFPDSLNLLSGPPIRPADGISFQSSRMLDSPPVRVYQASKSQEGIFVEHMNEPLSSKYNLSLEIDLPKAAIGATVERTTQAIYAIVDRHAILRSTFTLVEGKLHIKEYAATLLELEIGLILGRTSEVRESAIKDILRRPFSLTAEFPARWHIVSDTTTTRLYLAGHHIALDGLALTELSKEFLALLENPRAELPAVENFNQMHMIEQAWVGSSLYQESKRVMLDQFASQSHASWPKRPSSLDEDESVRNVRQLNVWATYSTADLERWSALYKTSWFRVATSMIGLLITDVTRTPFGRAEVLSCGYASRPGELRRCVGQFANALPVKFPLWEVLRHGEDSFGALVMAMSRNISAVKKAELFSVAEAVRSARELNPDCEAPRVAVTIIPRLAAGCRVFPVEGRWDLYFCFQELQDGVTLGVIFDPQIFNLDSMKSMRTKFGRLYNASVENAAVKLRDMIRWLPQHPSLPGIFTTGANRHVHHYFDAHAETCPSSLALHSAELGISLTYGQLYASTEYKAQVLQARGILPRDIVIISIGRGFAIIEWILGVLKCGAAFTYLDPELADGPKANILNVCQAAFIIDETFIAEAYSQGLSDSASGQNIDTAALETTKNGTSDDDLAYVIFTSGSTGLPKGVMVEHGNLNHYLKAAASVFDCGYGSRVLQLASFSFDASILEWTAALCMGGCLCFAEHAQQLVGDYLADVIDQNDISFMQITPSNLETIPFDRDLPSLRQVSVGGEAGSKDLFHRWHSRVNLVNAYGPTEASIAVCFNRIDIAHQISDVITVGRPNPSTEIFICGNDFGPILDTGTAGEICIAGPQVARGYLHRPEAQSQSFRTHKTNRYMYRTGDKGIILEDGSVLVTGRTDRELKVRGFRIAPEEIEMAILQSGDGIREASVHASESKSELIAFVAPNNLSAEQLRGSLKRQLPDYKIPTSFIFWKSLPRNISGKIDHKAVKAQVGAVRKPPGLVEHLTDSRAPVKHNASVHQPKVQSYDESFNAPEIQHTIGQLWAEVIGLSQIPRPNINFFDVGGHSLLVSKLHVKLKAAFPDTSVRLPQLFSASTIQKQTQLYLRSKTAAARSNVEETPALAPSARAKTPVNGHAHPLDSLTRANDMHPNRLPTPSRLLDQQQIGSASCDRSMAIIGMAGRFPGAQNVDEFYEKLRQGYLGIVDSGLKIKPEILPNNIWVSQAGFLSEIEDFDPEFFHLTEEAATEMDPQQRLFMEVAYEALFDAGLDPQSDLELGKRIGLFVGAANPAYHLHTHSVATDNFLRQNRGFVMPSISALTAYHLNMSGPNVTVQNNCASSTVALSLAVDSIRSGRCDYALVGGISVQLYDGGYTTYHGTENGQIFSPRGICSPFDSSADGTVPADAVTAFVLSRHGAAVANETLFYAEILGTGIGSDGALEKVGFQVPSPRGQAEVMKKAWRDSEADVSKLRYMEIHGSGTPIGDALELEGLMLAAKDLGRSEVDPFTVGSTKGNIGNTQHASGLVSLVKICMSIQNGIVPATKGLNKLNSMIDATLPIHFATRETKLESGDLIGVSATGWGGVNSHTVVALPPDRLRKTQTRRLPPDFFKRQRLQAPRFSGDNTVEEQGNNQRDTPQTIGHHKENSQVTLKINGVGA